MKHEEFLVHLMEQYEQKNAAYGNNAHKTYCRYGKASYSMRLSDKMQRLIQLTSNPEISEADESIEDTIGDAVTYAIMYAADLRCHDEAKLKAVNYTENDEDNIQKTREMLRLLACCTKEETDGMAQTFKGAYLKNDISLADAVYVMYVDHNTTSAEYVLLASYLISLYDERMGNE